MISIMIVINQIITMHNGTDVDMRVRRHIDFTQFYSQCWAWISLLKIISRLMVSDASLDTLRIKVDKTNMPF